MFLPKKYNQENVGYRVSSIHFLHISRFWRSIWKSIPVSSILLEYTFDIKLSTLPLSISSRWDSCNNTLSYLRFPLACQSLTSSSLETSLFVVWTLIYFFLVVFTSYGLFFHIGILSIKISLSSTRSSSKSKTISGKILFREIFAILSSKEDICFTHSIIESLEIQKRIIHHSAFKKLTISQAIESAWNKSSLNSSLEFSHFSNIFSISIYSWV